jgi:DNA-binding NtrC family response regulator
MARILILDDLLDAVNLIRRILLFGGHDVVGFTDEEEALEHVRAHPVDLVILDMKLKRLTGIEVLRDLRKINPAVRVMMITAYPGVETADEALLHGAADYCVKPIEAEELERKVTTLLGTRAHSGSADPPGALPPRD